MKYVWLCDWKTYRSAVLSIWHACERTTRSLFGALEGGADDNGYIKIGRLLGWKDNFRSSCHSHKYTNLWVLFRKIVWTLPVFEFMDYRRTSENTEVLTHMWIFIFFFAFHKNKSKAGKLDICEILSTQFFLASDHIMLKCIQKQIFIA